MIFLNIASVVANLTFLIDNTMQIETHSDMRVPRLDRINIVSNHHDKLWHMDVKPIPR